VRLSADQKLASVMHAQDRQSRQCTERWARYHFRRATQGHTWQHVAPRKHAKRARGLTNPLAKAKVPPGKAPQLVTCQCTAVQIAWRLFRARRMLGSALPAEHPAAPAAARPGRASHTCLLPFAADSPAVGDKVPECDEACRTAVGGPAATRSAHSVHAAAPGGGGARAAPSAPCGRRTWATQ